MSVRVHPPHRVPAGFALVEVLAAALIAVLAVTGLAYSFGIGRALINRYEVARAGLAAAQERLEILKLTPVNSLDFSVDTTHTRPFVHAGQEVGTVDWYVTWYDDPGSPSTSHDMKNVLVTVHWGNLPGESLPDTGSVSLSRLFMAN